LQERAALPELFKDGIVIIYAVVIGISFDLSKDILVPIYFTSQHLIRSSILFLGYFIVLSSWREYFSSMRSYPHKGNFGFGRYILDLLILFVFYYIITIAIKQDSYLIPDVFTYVMPSLFFMFFLWDLFRKKEYPTDRILKSEKNISRNFMFLFLGMALTYLLVSYISNFDSFGPLAFYRDLIFSILTIFTVIIYRIRKWQHSENSPT
jgi:hypothetical protein